MYNWSPSPTLTGDSSALDKHMGALIVSAEQGKAILEYLAFQGTPIANVTYIYPGDPETESFPGCRFDYRNVASSYPIAEALGKFQSANMGFGTYAHTQEAYAPTVGGRLPSFGETPLGGTSKVVVSFVNANDNMVVDSREVTELSKRVEELTDKVRELEELAAESHKIILAFSQSYYWTPEWQAKEERADEDEQLGRFKQYDDVEEFIREMKG